MAKTLDTVIQPESATLSSKALEKTNAISKTNSVSQSNVIWQEYKIDQTQRSKLKGHKPAILWFTGLSGSGKSTVANQLEVDLNAQGIHTYLLDGDNVRHGLCQDLGFNDADRIENIRRIGETAKLMADAGLVVITAFISPFRADRDSVRSLVEDVAFIEVFLKTPLEVCEQRDPKGLYQKARQGEIPNFTGISSEYQAPLNAEIEIDTQLHSVKESAEKVHHYLQQQGII